MSAHEDLIKQEDQQLDEITELALRLHNHANIINAELMDQQVKIEKLNNEVDDNIEKMNFVMKKLAKLLKTGDSKTLCTVMILMMIVVVLFVLVFYT
jgi:t-SNARE complex subunit (syntaxin)